MNICYIVAMEAEAKPFIEMYGVKKIEGAFGKLPCLLYQEKMQSDSTLSIVVNGTLHGSSLIGCEAATLTTLKAIELLHPDLVINSGTCGGFVKHGAAIGKVYIGNGVMFHDRRVMGDDEWGTQALGNYSLWSESKSVAEALQLPMGKVTTGSSLDMQPCDQEVIDANGGQLKDMEAAAVAFVCSLLDIPCMLIKSVTDLIDGGENTLEEFHQNLALASTELAKANIRLINHLVV